jgi:AraC-like DNA-binding protein
MFKATYGCPPREYRAAHAAGEMVAPVVETAPEHEYDLAA